MSITLRTKKLSNGTESLYLDINHGGQRTKEFLDMRLYVNPKNVDERRHNKVTQQAADALRARKEYELAPTDHDVVLASTRKQVNFFDYLQDFIDHYHKGDIKMYHSTQRYLREYVDDPYLNPKRMDEKFCQRFKDFLDNHSNLHGPLLGASIFIGTLSNSYILYMWRFTVLFNKVLSIWKVVLTDALGRFLVSTKHYKSSTLKMSL